jgi:hypothetical protein
MKGTPVPNAPRAKSFLVLFFKKEHLSSLHSSSRFPNDDGGVDVADFIRPTAAHEFYVQP